MFGQSMTHHYFDGVVIRSELWVFLNIRLFGERLLLFPKKVWLKWSNKKALGGIVIKINLQSR